MKCFMTEKSYLPSKDSDLQFWATNFLSVANANLVTTGKASFASTFIAPTKNKYFPFVYWFIYHSNWELC